MNIITILSSILTGIYAVIIFIIISIRFPVKEYFASNGISNRWIIFASLLFIFGFIKHQIGYYLTIDSNYCKQTEICEKNIFNPNHKTLIDKLKSVIGFMESFWLENISEGVVFVLVGLPAFLIIENKLIAAFITGILADIFSEYSGLHKYFCRTTCNSTFL